jgi:hypothetical protein
MADDLLSREMVMQRGTAVPANEELRTLYRQAFAEHGARALWSSRPVAAPSLADVLAITESLRVEGNLAARRLAERIERICRAAI